jgi:hypothetical protein
VAEATQHRSRRLKAANKEAWRDDRPRSHAGVTYPKSQVFDKAPGFHDIIPMGIRLQGSGRPLRISKVDVAFTREVNAATISLSMTYDHRSLS